MENFYVTYDATIPNETKVGLSYDFATNGGVLDPEADKSEGGSAGLVITIVVVGVLAIMLVGAIFGFRFMYKRNQAQKLEKAKTYFESLKTEDKGEDKDVEAEDPNSFC